MSKNEDIIKMNNLINANMKRLEDHIYTQIGVRMERMRALEEFNQENLEAIIDSKLHEFAKRINKRIDKLWEAIEDKES